MPPLVSILIPVYNREKIIEQTIQSALNQHYDNVDIILVDNCSTDSTYEILKSYQSRYPNIRIARNDSNLGPVKNWVACLNLAQGKYIKFLWSDDQIFPDYLSHCVEAFEKNPKIGFVYTQTILEEKLTRKAIYRFGPSGEYPSIDFIKSHILGTKSVPVSPGCALFRKIDVEKNLLVDLPNEHGLIFSQYGAGNDLLLFLLTAHQYSHFYYIDLPLSLFTSHADSLTVKHRLERFYYYSKLWFLKQYHYHTLYQTLALRLKLSSYHALVNEKISLWSILSTLPNFFLLIKNRMLKRFN